VAIPLPFPLSLFSTSVLKRAPRTHRKFLAIPNSLDPHAVACHFFLLADCRMFICHDFLGIFFVLRLPLIRFVGHAFCLSVLSGVCSLRTLSNRLRDSHPPPQHHNTTIDGESEMDPNSMGGIESVWVFLRRPYPGDFTLVNGHPHSIPSVTIVPFSNLRWKVPSGMGLGLIPPWLGISTQERRRRP